MSYLQLLNPKGFAKEKSKEEKSKKKAPSYGPQQSRKPPTSEAASPIAKVPRFDPKALLNPRAAAGHSRSTASVTEESSEAFDNDGDASSATMEGSDTASQANVGSLYEQLYNVGKREAPPPRKRKSENIEDAEISDEDHKKAKTTFTGASNGGILGGYLKEEREKGAAESGPSTGPIDLTNDDDGDDVTFLGEKLSAADTEVCLGRIAAQCNAHKIPVPLGHQMGKLGKDHSPQMRVDYRKLENKNNNVIELFYKRSGGPSMKFGMVDIRVASVLCPLLNDTTRMRIKVFVDPFRIDPNENAMSRVSRLLQLSIILYAPRKFAKPIGTRLSQRQLWLSQPVNQDRGTEYVNPHVPDNLGGLAKGAIRRPQSSQPSYHQRTEEQMVRDASTMFDSLVKSEDLPEMETDALITTALMSHQKQALYFLTQHERTEEGQSEDESKFSLWKQDFTKNRETWYNVITNHKVAKKPDPLRGGILADMMGLGKTLSILALLTSTLAEAKAFGDSESPVNLESIDRNAKSTLIICPKSVMSNWEEQVKLHTKRKALKVYSYHGSSRTQDVSELAGYDIVLTSYSTAAAEFSDKTNRRNALASIQWFRIVLDEAHQIRNQSTQVAKACYALYAQRRWAVTGTPVQNRLDDLGALIKFLRIKPFDDGSSWTTHILVPFRNANQHVLQHLRLLVDSITLRRMKDKIGLVDRREHIVRLNFSDEEMAIYSQFSKESNTQLKIMLRESGRMRGKSYAHVLKSLGRLRMICAHGREMLSEDDMKELEGLTAATAIDLGDEPGMGSDESFISERHAYDTLHLMSETENDLCIACTRKIGDPKADPEAVADETGDIEGSDDSSSSASSDTENDNDSDTMGYLTPCYHLICPGCKDEHATQATASLRDDNWHNCPYCDQYVRFDLFELQRSVLRRILEARDNKYKKGKKAKWDESSYTGPHTKVQALLKDLENSAAESRLLPPGEPPIRSIVFSGWTTYLDLIEYALDENNISFVRLDGSMSLKARSSVLHTFKTNPEVTVMLVSIKAGGQGLNFTAANKVYMMEPQFNPGVEQQAIDRVHRLGQKRDVEISHYIMRESVEEKILLLQQKKEKLANMAMEKKMGKDEEARKRIEELRDLFK